MVERCTSVDQPGWLTLRETLWPQCPREQQRIEMQHSLDNASRFMQFVAYDEQLRPIGFVEASLRHDYVNGTETSPVAFLEGIYVVPEHR